MAKYALIFHGGRMPQSGSDGATIVKAWTDWFTRLGDAIVDPGNPVSQVRTVGADGSVREGGANPASGYAIIKADGIDQAVALAKGCPALLGGASVEVAETFEMM